MQSDISQNISTQAAPVQTPEFHQMADGMKKALDEFQAAKPSDLFGMVTSYLAPVGDFAITGWKSASSFVRRHPVETSIAVGALGLLAAYMMMPMSEEKEPAKRPRRKSAKSA